MSTDKNHTQFPESADADTESVPAGQTKKSAKKRGRSTAAAVMDSIGSWMTGTLLIAFAAACFFGPAIASELREDKIMSVLDLNEDALRDTPMGDLIDIRKYVDEYESDDEVNRRAAEKAGNILDGAIGERMGRN